MDKQTTLKGSFTLQGKGLHTGLNATITFNPAEPNTGYQIQRTDVEGQPIISALAENISETSRGTVIEANGVKVSTIEHAMAALYASKIDNCLIQIDQPEFPILDGSAKYYMEEIEKVGIEEQEENREYYIVRKRIDFKTENGSSITILPDDKFSVDVHITYPSAILNNQFASLENLEDFSKEIASCRTFVFVREIEQLINANLIKGGDLDNAIVIYDQKIEQSNIDHLCDVLGKEHVKVDDLGYLNKTPLNFDNECARHKLLDIIGDLALIGMPIKGHVIATCPGHTVNSQFTKKIRKELRRMETMVPVYDPNQEPMFDIVQIRKMLPHRYPMQLVDKIMYADDKMVIGIKNLTGNEEIFNGHFPSEPVMPGVLQVEAMAQTGGILVLRSVPDPENYSTYFMKIDNVKFRSKAVPGDTLIFKLVLMTPVRRGIATMKGYAFVGDKIVSEAEFTAQIAKNK